MGHCEGTVVWRFCVKANSLYAVNLLNTQLFSNWCLLVMTLSIFRKATLSVFYLPKEESM